MAKVFHFSEAVSIALHSMVLIAQSEKQINAGEISKQTGFSRNHLAKVLQRLVKHGLLKSNRGPSGGFVLKKPAEKISFIEIYELIEGSIDTNVDCPLDCNICPFNDCLMGGLVDNVVTEFKDYFNNKTLADFCK